MKLIEKRVIHLPDGQEHVAEDTTLQKNENTGQWEKIIKEILDVYNFSYYIPSNNLGIIKVRDERVYGKISIN